MRVLVIYGPPAAGKLSVAETIARDHGFRLLPNHATFDLVSGLLPIGTPAHAALLARLRLTILEVLAEEGVDVVLTHAYAPGFEVYADEIRAAVEPRGGVVSFVRLAPSPDVLEARVVGDSRRQRGKPSSVEGLRRALEDNDCYGWVDGTDVSIDNSALSVESTAAQLVSALGIVQRSAPSV